MTTGNVPTSKVLPQVQPAETKRRMKMQLIQWFVLSNVKILHTLIFHWCSSGWSAIYTTHWYVQSGPTKIRYNYVFQEEGITDGLYPFYCPYKTYLVMCNSNSPTNGLNLTNKGTEYIVQIRNRTMDDLVQKKHRNPKEYNCILRTLYPCRPLSTAARYQLSVARHKLNRQLNSAKIASSLQYLVQNSEHEYQPVPEFFAVLGSARDILYGITT